MILARHMTNKKNKGAYRNNFKGEGTSQQKNSKGA
jgi:hypothetical protein